MTSELERLGPGPGSPGGGAVDSVDGQTGAVDLTNSYQAKDADLTAIAGLSASNDDFVQRKSGAWSNRTVAQVKTDLGITDEDLQDLIGAMVSGNTETNITVTYDDTNGKLNFVVSTAPPTERSITAAGSTAAYTDRIVADTTSAAFSLGLPAAASGQLPFVITNIGPNLLTLTGTVSGEVNPTVPQWSSRTIASNGTILYFT
jgi:hypothetical protein